MPASLGRFQARAIVSAVKVQQLTPTASSSSGPDSRRASTTASGTRVRRTERASGT